MSTNFNSFYNQKNLVDFFSMTIAKKLEEAIKRRSKATLLVSGGNTPKAFFEKLRTQLQVINHAVPMHGNVNVF